MAEGKCFGSSLQRRHWGLWRYDGMGDFGRLIWRERADERKNNQR